MRQFSKQYPTFSADLASIFYDRDASALKAAQNLKDEPQDHQDLLKIELKKILENPNLDVEAIEELGNLDFESCQKQARAFLNSIYNILEPHQTQTLKQGFFHRMIGRLKDIV